MNILAHVSVCMQGVKLQGGNVYKCSFDHIAVQADYNMVIILNIVFIFLKFYFCAVLLAIIS